MAGYADADLRLAAEAAVRAPSLHNSQPWRFRLREGAIEVLADRSRQLRVADAGGWAVRIACGAATCNARLALAAAGRPADVLLRPHGDLIARLTPGRPRPATYAETDLAAAIPRRFSNRRPFWPDPVPSEIRVRLIEAARAEAAWLDLLVGATALNAFGEIARGADRVLRRDPAYQAEFFGWAHADAAPDGVPVAAGAPAVEPQDLLPQRAYSERRRAAGRDFEPEPLLAVLGAGADRPVDQVAAGQALQRVLLTATDAGLATSLISQPIEVPPAREQLRRSLGRSGMPQIALRIGYGQAGHPAPRRPVDEVLQPDS
ncbi:Acg family FMN-binding oxidoreductase [Couchioplanes caeruleus]|uniref:Nitroreductase n=2 Tax=Couchioplanes caeruleus TaxID=56438 RepID=A0A1K0GML8_9ACTN|nr:nitroreductase family protein [Couchioplanes caeruleus]OJF12324.1 nitroreductase [Couchioplanes caeruleus subsp. caeruleus]ROP34497.1 nitroreductase family protein [Couchioplanes caeruleus]